MTRFGGSCSEELRVRVKREELRVGFAHTRL